VVRVGQVVGAFGTQGAVKVKTLTDFPERFAPGAELFLHGSGHRVEWSRRQPTGLVVKLAGVDDREMAQARRGCFLEVPDETLHPLPADRWYHHDLVGLAVATRRGRDLGTLVEVVDGPANDVWVARRGSEEHLVPVTRDAVLAVDVAAGHVTVADWLLEVEDVPPHPGPPPPGGREFVEDA
jgi:16S rRNA processing protein RimM